MRKIIVKKQISPKSRWLPSIKDTCDTCRFLTGKECPFKAEQTIEEIKAKRCLYHIRKTQ